MKILFLSVSSNIFFYSQAVKPFGLLSLAACVSGRGYQMSGIEMNDNRDKVLNRYLRIDEKLLGQIVDFSPDVVAMSTYSSNIHNVLFWAETLKKALGGVSIVIGGNHASYIAGEILETCPHVDFIIRFEGEIGFEALCRELEGGKRNFSSVPNIVYRSIDGIVENPLAAPIKDLGRLSPMPFDLFRYENHENQTHADIITSRGCPFRCTFCNCNHYWEKRYRSKDVSQVVEDIYRLKELYPNLQSIRIRDEAISIDRRHCLNLCKQLKNFGLDLKYQGHSRLDGLDEEIIENLAEAGFTQIYVGLESGSKRVLKRLQKDIDIDKAPEVARLSKKYKLPMRFSFIVLTPGETLEDLHQTFELQKTMELDFDQFYYNTGLQIYPGTYEAARFIEVFPGYRWLKESELGHDYFQVCDEQNNPLIVMHHDAQYSKEEFYEEREKFFSDKLQSIGLSSFKDLKKEQSSVKIHLDRLRGDCWEKKNLFRMIRRLDSGADSWAVCISGILSSCFPKDDFNGNAYSNLKDIITPEELISPDADEKMRRRLSNIQYLLLLMSENRATDLEMFYRIRYEWKYSGHCIIGESWMLLPFKTQERLLGQDHLKTLIPKNVRLANKWQVGPYLDMSKIYGFLYHRNKIQILKEKMPVLYNSLKFVANKML